MYIYTFTVVIYKYYVYVQYICIYLRTLINTNGHMKATSSYNMKYVGLYTGLVERATLVFLWYQSFRT